MTDSDSKPDIASVAALTINQPLYLEFAPIQNP
jgi:hypothetical protein